MKEQPSKAMQLITEWTAQQATISYEKIDQLIEQLK
jgi:hypothetical protein